MSSQSRSVCKLDINSSWPPSQAHDINTIAFISISFPPVSYVYFAYAFRILSIFYHIFARILTSCQFRLSTLSNLGSGSPFTHSLSSCISAADLENTTPLTHHPHDTHGLGLGQLRNNTLSSATACATLVIADVSVQWLFRPVPLSYLAIL
ncbi:hypothetical protein F5Y04DRAFT_33469 [Hypomontagnella monticulosa]|nr:hypothetical protein F5Y04DRAFT_33469 [Hypomontagnella monticulosa]